MNNLGSNIEDAKRRGEWAELRFMAAAIAHGLRINKVWGESAPYDLVVDGNARLFRVQVKCTVCHTRRGYIAHAQNGRGPYPPNSFDIFAIYIAPEDIWYIIPADRVSPSGHVRVKIKPGRGLCQYVDFREAWHLLGARDTAQGAIAKVVPSLRSQPDSPIM